MEGLQLRSIRLWSKGVRVDDVYRIIENNTRFPTELMGDIEAQLAGCLQGRDLMAALASKYGCTTFLTAMATILDDCERSARAKISAIPNGTYEAESSLDDDGIGTEPIPIKVRIIVEGDEMTVDYSEMPPQVRSSINSGAHGGGVTTARIAFKYLIATDEPANAGTFRPLKLILPPGTLVSAKPGAAMGNYGFPFPTIVDTFIRALEKALPEQVTGAHFGSYSSVRFIGTFADGTAAGAHPRAATARVRSARWLTATHASFRSSCKSRCIRIASKHFRCAKTRRVPESIAAAWASARRIVS
jgi:N-methylhydantoinase B